MEITRNSRIKHLLLLVILGIAATHLIVSSYINHHSYSISKIAGLIFFVVVYALNRINFRLSVVACGLFLLLAWFGLVTLSPVSKELGFSFTVAGQSIPIVNGQPLLLIAFFYHFITMKDFYFGILTGTYWKTIWQKDNKSEHF